MTASHLAISNTLWKCGPNDSVLSSLVSQPFSAEMLKMFNIYNIPPGDYVGSWLKHCAMAFAMLLGGANEGESKRLLVGKSEGSNFRWSFVNRNK